MKSCQKPPTRRRAELESRVQLSDQVHQIISHALAERKLEPAPPTKAEATGNIRENRAEERLRERENAVVPEGVRAEPASLQSELTPKAHDSYAGERTAQVIDLLKRIRPGQAK